MSQDNEQPAVGTMPSGCGVYYSRGSAPGVLLRLLVSLIDVSVLVLVLIACGVVGRHVPRDWLPVYAAAVVLVQWALHGAAEKQSYRDCGLRPVSPPGGELAGPEAFATSDDVSFDGGGGDQSIFRCDLERQ